MRVVLVASLLVASLGSAQTQPTPKPQKVEFGDDLIEGGREVPLGAIYEVVKRPGFHSLIKVRMNFDDKLRESVHEM